MSIQYGCYSINIFLDKNQTILNANKAQYCLAGQRVSVQRVPGMRKRRRFCSSCCIS